MREKATTNRPTLGNKLAIFLGSGASAFAGYRTFANFKQMLFDNDTRSSEGLPKLHPDTVDIVTEVVAFLATDDREPTHDNILWVLNDYKSFCLNVAKNHKLRNRFEERIRGQISGLDVMVQEAIDDITRLSIHHYSADRVASARESSGKTYFLMNEVANFYLTLASYNGSLENYLRVFTTNYDLLLEDIFADPHMKIGVPLVTGFGPKPSAGRPWGLEEYANHTAKGLHLWRVHGCAAWYYHAFRDPNVYFHRSDALHQDWRNNLCVMFPGREIWRGNWPHAQGFHSYYDAVLHSNGIVFIGFSFRDHDVVQSLMVGNYHRKTPMRLVVVNPTVSIDYLMERFKLAASNCTIPTLCPSKEHVKVIPGRFGTEDTNHQELANLIISWLEENADDKEERYRRTEQRRRFQPFTE